MMTRSILLERHRCIIGLQIERCRLPSAAKEVLLEALERSLETAAEAHQAGVAPLSVWCSFDLPIWASTLHLEPATLLWLCDLLMTAHILRFETHSQNPEQGILIWNLAFDEWTPLQPDPGGGAKTLRASAALLPTPWSASTRRASALAPARLTPRGKGRPPRLVWRVLRRMVLERDDFCCQYCGRRRGTLTCDHMLPVSRGGTSDLENLVTACSACNTSKATKTLAEWLIAWPSSQGKGAHDGEREGLSSREGDSL